MDTEINNIKIAIEIVQYLYLVPVLIGLILNTLAFIIFSRTKFKNTIFSTYFRCLCISDTTTLIYIFVYVLIEKLFISLFEIIYLCKILNYFLYILPSLSIWVLVVISIDRVLSIIYPARFLFRRSEQNQIMISFAIVIFHAIYWLSVPISAHISVINEPVLMKSLKKSK